MESDKIASQFNSAASEYDKQRTFIPVLMIIMESFKRFWNLTDQKFKPFLILGQEQAFWPCMLSRYFQMHLCIG